MRWWWLLAMTACTSVLGLAPTAQGPDRDGDGVFDVVDNCPDVPNADQDPSACASCRIGMDLDRDGIDDGCDACPRGRNDEDEDGDGIADACDTCPAVLDPAQTDTDGDGVGDACDRTPDVLARRYFDGFDRDLPAWISPTPWPADHGVRTAPDAAKDLELFAVRLSYKRDGWTITVGLTLPALAELPGTVGLDLFDESRLYPLFCGFIQTGTGWALEIDERGKGGSTPSAIELAPNTHVDLRVYAQQDALHCEANGTVATTYTAIQQLDRGIALHATVSAAFEYADIIAP